MLAARASLQRIYTDQIMTPRQLFLWEQTICIKNMNFVYKCQKEIMENRRMLHTQHEEARPIPGTQTFHTFIPGTRNELIIKKISTDTTSEVHETNIPQETLSLKEI